MHHVLASLRTATTTAATAASATTEKHRENVLGISTSTAHSFFQAFKTVIIVYLALFRIRKDLMSCL
jgi:hypothetical protein